MTRIQDFLEVHHDPVVGPPRRGEPARTRSTLAFAGLFQLTHEMLKRNVLEEVGSFFGYSKELGAPTWLYGLEGKARYEAAVLSLDPSSDFRASLLWLVAEGAITRSQMDVLDRVQQHRHDLTHRSDRHLVNPG